MEKFVRRPLDWMTGGLSVTHTMWVYNDVRDVWELVREGRISGPVSYNHLTINNHAHGRPCVVVAHLNDKSEVVAATPLEAAETVERLFAVCEAHNINGLADEVRAINENRGKVYSPSGDVVAHIVAEMLGES